MYALLVRLMVLAAVAQFGLSVADLRNCRGRACVLPVQRAALKVLQIDWKPISVFPAEAKRFRR
jgi:hypothetical protein